MDTFSLVVDIAPITSTTTEERLLCHGIPGEWLLSGASWMPSADLSANGTNYGSVGINEGAGGTSLGTVTSESTAFTKGTAREFTLSSALFGPTDAIEIDVNKAGSGGTVDGALTMVFTSAR